MSFRVDSQTQYVGGEDGDKKAIDHGASAKENLKEAGRNLKNMVTLDKLGGVIGGGSSSAFGVGIGLAVGLGGLARAAAADIFDLVGQPVAAVKNLADAAVHGIVAGFKKIVD